ncbi:MAG TPA: type III pantothenate kinase [Candidatus Omnitrophota bacterium]|nr:type III pantothenate kinase [Candidatus Omnitrophota bacterium]
MICAISAGNTNSTAVIFKKNLIVSRVILETQSPDENVLKNFLVRYRPDTVVISGVVPAAVNRLTACVRRVLSARIYVVGKNKFVPMSTRYRNRKMLGADRLLCAYAAYHLYGGALVVIDAGTAITIDAISQKGIFWGGRILPGIDVSLRALHEHTALLPVCRFKEPVSLLGTDTKSCMLSGVVRGAASLCDGAIEDYKKVLGLKIKVIATGGNARTLQRYSKRISIIDRDLLFKGMRLLIPE